MCSFVFGVCYLCSSLCRCVLEQLFAYWSLFLIDLCSLLIFVPYWSLFLIDPCSLSILVPYRSLFLIDPCSLSILVPYRSLFFIDPCSLLILVPYRSLFLIDHCSLSILVPYRSLFLIDPCSLSILLWSNTLTLVVQSMCFDVPKDMLVDHQLLTDSACQAGVVSSNWRLKDASWSRFCNAMLVSYSSTGCKHHLVFTTPTFTPALLCWIVTATRW